MNHDGKLVVKDLTHTHTQTDRRSAMNKRTFTALALAATAIGVATANPNVAVSAYDPSYTTTPPDTSPAGNPDRSTAYIENSVGFHCWEDDSCRKTAAGYISPFSPKTKATARKHARALLGPDGKMTCTATHCTQTHIPGDPSARGQITFRYHPAKRMITYRLTASYCLAGGMCER
jgi:hypothetical protein